MDPVFFDLGYSIHSATIYDIPGTSIPRFPNDAFFRNPSPRFRRFIPMTNINPILQLYASKYSSHFKRKLPTLTVPIPFQKPGLILNSSLEFNPPIPKTPQRHNFLPPSTHRASKTSQEIERVLDNPLSEDFGWYC